MSRRPKAFTASGDSSKVCSHPGIFKNMCIKCGICMDGVLISTAAPKSAIKSTDDGGHHFKTLTIAGGQQLQLSQEEAIAIQASKSSSLKLQRKLALVLDLDHTLVHSIQVEGPMPPTSNSSDQPTPQRNPSVSDIPLNDMQCHHLPVEETSLTASGTQALRHLMMKKRPFLDRFLALCSEFCQMIVYTAGTRRYAEAVQRIIDPTRRYFGDRLVSRSDGAGAASGPNNSEPTTNLFIHKSLERIFLGDYSMAVILDDREDVWRVPPQGPGHSDSSQVDQLLLVRPYVFFSGQNMVEANNCSGPLNAFSSKPNQANSQSSPVIALAGPQPGRLLKMAASFSPEHTEADDQLVRCYDILKAIHAKAYSASPPSAAADPSDGKQKLSLPRSLHQIAPSLALQQPQQPGQGQGEAATWPVSAIISEMKSGVLAGCTLTFSGIIPTKETFPEQHVLWRLAESLGAQVSVDLLPRTTHLISVHLLTHKVCECLQTRAHDVWVLHPDWLFYCRWSLSRAAETTFMINALRPGAKYPNPLMNRTPLTPRSMQVRPPIAAPMSVEQRQAPDLSLARPNAAGIIKKRKVDPGDESDATPVEDDGCVRPKRRKNTGSFHADEEEDGEGYYFHDEDNVKKDDDDEGDDDDNEDCEKIDFEFDDQDNDSVENDTKRNEGIHFADSISNQQFRSTESFPKLDSDTDSDDFSDFDSFLLEGHVKKKA